jgi:hypothetical protein
MHSQRSLLALLLGASLAKADMTEANRTTGLRWLTVLLGLGVILDLVISAVIGYGIIQINRTASQTHQVKVAAYEACLANNDSKTADSSRWAQVLKLIEDGSMDPRLLAFVAGVQKANAEADRPRNCQLIAP